jgi:hypothetical protein
MDALLPDPTVRPMVGFDLACQALDIGKTKGYELVAADAFPVPVRRVGGVWKVPTAPLRRYLGFDPPLPPLTSPLGKYLARHASTPDEVDEAQ